MLRRILNWLNRRRLRSELAALRLAKNLPTFSMIIIGANCCFWALIFAVPTVPLQILLFSSDVIHQPSWPGFAVFAPVIIIAGGVLVIAFLWLFEWYVIALTLMFGRRDRADKKELWLVKKLTVR